MRASIASASGHDSGARQTSSSSSGSAIDSTGGGGTIVGCTDNTNAASDNTAALYPISARAKTETC